MPLLRCVFRLIVRLFLVCGKRRDARIKLAQFFRVSGKGGMNIKIARGNTAAARYYFRICANICVCVCVQVRLGIATGRTKKQADVDLIF